MTQPGRASTAPVAGRRRNGGGLPTRMVAALRPAGSERAFGSRRVLLLAGVVVGAIVAAGAANVADAPAAVQALLRVALLVSFALLVLASLAAAFAVVVLEVVVAGASGHWTEFGAGVGGRIALEVVLMAAVVVAFARRALDHRPLPFGRYGLHALAVAVFMPAVWMTVGLARGNRPGDVVGDGNGVLFLAFALGVSLLVAGGHGARIRHWFFVACIVNGAVTGVLVVLSATRLVALTPTLSHVVVEELGAGNAVGYMPNGAYRLYLASGLFLPIGIALAGYRLLRQPRSTWLWAVYALFWADLVATYTRGLWLGGLASLAIVAAFGSRHPREGLRLLAGTAALFAAATPVGYAAGWSLPEYVGRRGSTILTSASQSFRLPHQVANGGFEGARIRPWRAVGGVDAAKTQDEPFAGSASLRLEQDESGRDAYVLQNLALQPNTAYTFEARARADGVESAAPAARGVVVWDVSGGQILNAPLKLVSGWQTLRLVVDTRAKSRLLQVRLYAPEGVVDWDEVRVERGRRPGVPPAILTRVTPMPGSVALQIGLEDTAGQASNLIRREQARILLRHIKTQPLVGHGYGAIAADYPYSESYSYELTYLDVLFKTGVIGLLLLLSFPLRLCVDGVRARRSRLALPDDVSPYAMSIVLSTVAVILLQTATNPVLATSFGLLPIVLMIAWLDPVAGNRRRGDRRS